MTIKYLQYFPLFNFFSFAVPFPVHRTIQLVPVQTKKCQRDTRSVLHSCASMWLPEPVLRFTLKEQMNEAIDKEVVAHPE